VRVRELHLATGGIAAVSDARSGTLELTVQQGLVPAEDPEPDKQTPWAGMSGAGVFTESGRLIGVVGQHHPGEGIGALTVRPLTALTDAPAEAVVTWWQALPQLPPPGGQPNSSGQPEPSWPELAGTPKPSPTP
jgi:hypothetical protein